MPVTLKPIDQQVIVVTGASSGIGLATARLAAERGARLVLAARSEDALTRLAAELGDAGRALPVVADVAKEEDVRAIAEAAWDAFGGFDTWVNNAGVSIYGTIEQVPVADMRQLFETNYWGVVYGSLEAVKGLRQRGGGALINVGSTLSDRAVPLQGTYSASKHAVKGFTDALRMELEHEGAPISVSLVKPGPIDTPYPHHAKNYLDAEPKHAPPVYAPELVARAIVHCAATPTRDVFVGSSAKLLAVSGYRTPRLTDKLMQAIFFSGSKSDQPPHPREQNGLDRPSGRLQERGGYPGHVRQTSVYTAASLHPLRTAAALAGVGLAAAGVRRAARNGA